MEFSDLSQVTVRGRLLSGGQIAPVGAAWQAEPLTGRVWFVPDVPELIHADSGSIIRTRPIAAELDSTGAFAADLPATDDSSFNPVDWTYSVVFSAVRGAEKKVPFHISVEEGTGPLELALLQPVTESEGMPVLLGPRGYSAYQVAVQNGFVGTEVEWLESLSADVDPALIAQAVEDYLAVNPIEVSDAAVAAFVDDTGSSTYASILAGFAATDDPRLSDARTPTAHKSTHATGGTDVLTPADIGAATPAQVASGDSATLSAAQSYAQALVDALTAASPATLDTLAEIAAALGEDPNFASTITTALGKRVRFDQAQTLSAPEQAQARSNIGAAAELGPDENYITDAEKTILSNTSGENTGDQDLSGYALTSSLGTAAAADAVDFATTAQGELADTASQPGHDHVSADVTDLTETVQDIVAAFLIAGTNVTVTHDDLANTFTIDATASGGGETDPEIVRDVIGAAMVAGSGIQITVNDAGDQITIASTAVLPTRQVASGTGLTGGGDMSADRTLAVDFAASGATSTTKAVRADDSRLSDSRDPNSHSHELGDLDATGATVGHVLTADGAGGAAWEAPSGGGGSDPWTYAVTSSDWTCPDTNTYTNIPDLSIPSGLAAGVYEVRVQVVSKGSNAHHWSIGKPSGGNVYTMARAGRGAGESRFANWTAAGGNGTIEVDSHPNGTWGAIAFECTSTLIVASATTTALTVMLRSTAGSTHTAMSGSFIAWRKIA